MQPAMAEDEFDIQYVSNLARISLTPEEERTLGAQLGEVLGYVKKLEELDVGEVEPMAHATPLANVTRADEPRPSISNATALANAPSLANCLLLAPKIVE